MGKSSSRQERSTTDKAPPDSDAVDEHANSMAPEPGMDTAQPPSARNVQPPQANSSAANPQTCCSNCQTVFEVSPELLALEDTRVRCGECLSIFDALANLLQDGSGYSTDEMLVEQQDLHVSDDEEVDPTLALAGDDFTASGDYSDVEVPSGAADDSKPSAQNDTLGLDVTYSDFDLFSGEAGIPEVEYFDQTQATDPLRFDEPDADETFSDTLFSHDLTIESPDTPAQTRDAAALAHDTLPLDSTVDFVTDEGHQESLKFEYRDRQQTEMADGADVAVDMPVIAPESSTPAARSSSGVGRWIFRSALAVVMLLLVAGLYGYQQRDALMHDPGYRPLVSGVCAVFGCQPPPLVNLDALKVVKRAVFSHPTISNALVIDMAFINEASFAQPYPVLEVRLTDRNGRLVVRNNIEPASYLQEWNSDFQLSAGQRLDVTLTVEDPGQTATSFELDFR